MNCGALSLTSSTYIHQEGHCNPQTDAIFTLKKKNPQKHLNGERGGGGLRIRFALIDGHDRQSVQGGILLPFEVASARDSNDPRHVVDVEPVDGRTARQSIAQQIARPIGIGRIDLTKKKKNSNSIT